MISRRRILSRSRDDDNLTRKYNPYEEEEGVWYTKDKLFKDHIQEILQKWEQIDDEIWAKIICMENKRRVAKAYARAPVLTIDGTLDGFDGYRIGLNGFENPLRDVKTEEIMRYIGKGCRVKIDEAGNIVIKRYSRAGIFIKGCENAYSDTSISNDIIKNNGLLECQKPYFLFDMTKFERNMTKELRSAYPDRKKLETQCICCIAFVKETPEMLDLPVWVMIINIVALDLLKSKFPMINTNRIKVPSFVSMFDRSKQVSDEDPYSLPVNESHYYASTNGTLLKKATIREPKPPKLPPRDFGKFKKQGKQTIKCKQVQIPTPDYSQDGDFCTMSKSFSKKMQPKYQFQDEDPYYSGMEARVTKFAKKQPNNEGKAQSTLKKMRKVFSSGYINTLLPPLTKKKRSKSYYYANYNSSESDPYTTLYDSSSNLNYEMYEPIYDGVKDYKDYYRRTQSIPRSTIRGNSSYMRNWDDYKKYY